jgi:serine/threonine protein kinase
MIIGTANYMSPEQAKGKEVDARSDIFSFGVVSYEMMAGSLPFEGESAMEMIGAILHKEPKPLPSDIPAEITKIIGKCLRKDRDERYQTVKLGLKIIDGLDDRTIPRFGDEMLKSPPDILLDKASLKHETENRRKQDEWLKKKKF